LPGAEHNDGDNPLRSCPIDVIVGPDGGHDLPQSRLLSLGRGSGAHLDELGLDLDLGLGAGDEVDVPGGVAGCPSDGGDEIVVAVAAEDQC
jgi:hypothetical protein